MAEKIKGTDTLRQAYPKLNGMIDEVNYFQKQIDEIVVEGDSSVEAAQARVSSTGTTYATLKERLDKEHNDVIAQLAQIKQSTEGLDKEHNDVIAQLAQIKQSTEGLDYAVGGVLRNTSTLKKDEEILPYIMDMSKIGDTSINTVNTLYESIEARHIYEWYDELVEQDREKRHSHIWGYLENGDPLKWYHFEPDMRYNIPNNSDGEPRFDAYNRLRGSKPLLFITSGVHGNEKTNIWALYLVLKDILNGKTELDRYIRKNYEIVLLPAVNPFGLKNNLRHNENGKNLNRLDEAEGEKGVDFVREVRDSFLSDLHYKEGMLFIDSHDFNYTNYENDRILWCGANDRELRKSLIEIGGMVQEKLLRIYPKLETGEHQEFFHLGATGTGYGETINAWNWKSGVRGYSLECPNNLTSLGVNKKYSLESARIGYIIVRDFLTQTTLNNCGITPPSTIVGFAGARTNENDDFLKTLHEIPSGSKLVVGVYNRNNSFSQHMPKDPNGQPYLGLFTATKADASVSKSGSMEFTTTGYATVRRFYGSFNPDGYSQWQEHSRGITHTTFTSLGLDSNEATILDVFRNLKNGEVAELYVTPTTHGINRDLTQDTSVKYGSIRIVRNTDLTGYVEHTTYSRLRNRKFINSISQAELTSWTELLTKVDFPEQEQRVKTRFTEIGVSNTATIMEIFNALGEGEIAELYITPSTTGIHADLPSKFSTNYGHLKIVKNSSTTGNIQALNYSSSHNRIFVNNINTSGMHTWTEILTEPV